MAQQQQQQQQLAAAGAGASSDGHQQQAENSALAFNLAAGASSSGSGPQALKGPDGKPFAPASVQIGGQAMQQVYVKQPGGGYVVYGQPPPFILGMQTLNHQPSNFIPVA